MADAVAIAAIVLLVIGMNILRVGPRSKEVVSRSRQALAILRDDRLSDEEKEIAVRAASVSLLAQAFALAGRTVSAFAMPGVLVASIILLGLAPTPELEQAFVSVPVLLAMILVVALDFAWRRWRS